MSNDSGKALVEQRKGSELVEIDKRGGVAVQSLRGLWALGELFSRSSMVPECYRGEKKIPDCAVACQMALCCGVNMMAFLQNSFVIKGKPSLEGKLLIALVNNSKATKGRIRFTYAGEGKTRSCTASVVDTETGEKYSYTLDWKTVEANGWNRLKSGETFSQWDTLWELRSSYRAATYLTRLYYPDLLMGMQTMDEADDIAPTGLQSGDTVPDDGLDALVVEMVKGPADEQDLQDEAANVQPTRADATAKAAGEREAELATDPDEQAKLLEAERVAEEKFVRPDDEPSDVPDDQPKIVQHFLQLLDEPDADLDAIASRVVGAREDGRLTLEQHQTIMGRVKAAKGKS